MDLINTPSRTRSKRVYDHSISGSPKNVENSAVKSSTRRKLNFDAVAYEVSILNLLLDITSSEKGCRNISLIYSNSRKTVSYENVYGEVSKQFSPQMFQGSALQIGQDISIST